MLSRNFGMPLAASIALLLIASSCTLSAEAPIRITTDFEEYYGGELDDCAHDMAYSDGFLYITGYTKENGEEDLLLLRYDTTGNLTWDRTVGGDGKELGNGIAVDGDAIYVAGSVEHDLLLMKFAANGTLLWERTWHDMIEYAKAVAVYNNTIYVVGTSRSYYNDIHDLVLLKYDSTGELLWNVTWSGKGMAYGEDIALIGEEIYVLSTTQGVNHLSRTIAILRYDSSGNLVWNNTWRGEDIARGYTITTGGNHIYLAGESDNKIILLKYNRVGSLVWGRPWGGEHDDQPQDIAVYDGHVYIIGTTGSYATPDEYGHITSPDIILLKYDVDGEMLQASIWGHGAWEDGMALAVGDYGTYLTGHRITETNYYWNVFIIKTNDVVEPEELPVQYYDYLAIAAMIIIILATILVYRRTK